MHSKPLICDDITIKCQMALTEEKCSKVQKWNSTDVNIESEKKIWKNNEKSKGLFPKYEAKTLKISTYSNQS